jgi:methyltransferase family protein
MKFIKNIFKRTFLYPMYIERMHQKKLEDEVELNQRIRGPLMDKYIPKNGIGAELGVLKGTFSRVLLKSTKAKELHLIDPWYFLDAEWTWVGENTSTVDALCNILQTNKKEINEKKFFVHVQDDIEVLKSFPDAYFDWAYIDSSHAYQHTVMELEILLKKVKSSGIICGDDWRPDINHRHHGVFKAVNEFINKHHYDLIYANEENLQWFIKKSN